MTRITGARTLDIRARTSMTLAGSDAVHQDPDYSGAYVFLATLQELLVQHLDPNVLDEEEEEE